MPRPAHHRAPNPRPNSSGVHFLTAAHVVDRLIRDCGIGPTDLVLDLGAGPGAVTARLARTGAKVIAVERDAEFVRQLRQRLSRCDNVRVVRADVRTMPLPHRAFSVVSCIPYAVSTALLRRLLTPQWTNLGQAALVVEWGFAKRITTASPPSREVAWWAARFELELAAHVPASSFRPAPAVNSAHLSIRRRADIDPRTESALWTLLGVAFDAGDRPVRVALARALGGRLAHRALLTCDIKPSLPARSVPAREWSALARLLVKDRSLHWPRLPAELTDGAVFMRARQRGR